MKRVVVKEGDVVIAALEGIGIAALSCIVPF
jgi:hypothetical protein